MKTVIFSIALAMFISCNRDKTEEIVQDQLPPITSYGANTAGCIINGKVLIPKNGNQAIGGPPIYGMNKSQGLNFWPSKNDYWQLEIANKKDTNGAGVILYIKNMSSGVGDYKVDQSNGELYMDGPNNNQIIASIRENGITKTYWSSNNSGTIKITRSDLFYGTSIFSGVFSCILYNLNNANETI
ncbi:MAG: hypothetical protein JST62_03815, partial [Bacteroidetes bacterium]|nr:hypothetical protein [Bacteroidota bacterium]